MASADLLVVAAMAAELAPLLRRYDRRPPFEYLVTGEGAVCAERALRTALARTRPARLLLLGISGGLSPDLRALDVIVATRVRDGRTDVGTPDSAWCSLAHATPTTIVVSPTILHTSAAKQAAHEALGIDGPAAVDLESGAFARLADEFGLPFTILRAISDTATESLPLDLERFRDPDGRIRRNAIARHAALRPRTWPGLIGLARRTRACAERLAACVETTLAG